MSAHAVAVREGDMKAYVAPEPIHRRERVARFLMAMLEQADGSAPGWS